LGYQSIHKFIAKAFSRRGFTRYGQKPLVQGEALRLGLRQGGYPEAYQADRSETPAPRIGTRAYIKIESSERDLPEISQFGKAWIKFPARCWQIAAANFAGASWTETFSEIGRRSVGLDHKDRARPIMLRVARGKLYLIQRVSGPGFRNEIVRGLVQEHPSYISSIRDCLTAMRGVFSISPACRTEPYSAALLESFVIPRNYSSLSAWTEERVYVVSLP